MALADTLRLGLQGFASGMAGRGDKFIEELNEQRKEAMAKDALQVQNLLQSGDLEGAVGLLNNRTENINRLGGDPSDTMGLLNKISGGDIEGALSDAKLFTSAARDAGYLPKLKSQIIGNQMVQFDPATGESSVSDIEGLAIGDVGQKFSDWKFNADTGQYERTNQSTGELETKQGTFADRPEDPNKERELYLREQQIALDKLKEERLSTTPSAGLEKLLTDSQDKVVAAQQQANKFETLANDYLNMNVGGGVGATVSEGFKYLLGSQDDVTELRREFNKVRMSEGLKFLPPGPATDKDVELAMKGVPPENAPADQVASFLRGAAKLARFNAGYNQFKADFISNKNSPKGLNKTWRKSVKSPTLNRDVSVAEIYATAQSRGLTPEDVMSQLGIQGGIYD